MTMAATFAKLIRGGHSGASSKLLPPAMRRLVLQEGVLPHLGSAPAVPAAGMGRLMHTEQCGNSGPLGTTRGVLYQNQKHAKMALFSGKRFKSDGPFGPDPGNFPWLCIFVTYTIGIGFVFAAPVRRGISWLMDDK